MSGVITLNERCEHYVDGIAADPSFYRIDVLRTLSGARILDFGIKAPGGLNAGLGLARACLSDMGQVAITAGIDGRPHVLVHTDHPVAACMASQYAGWRIQVGKFFAMGSGPMRAAYGKEKLFDAIEGREQPPVAVGILETRKLPDEAIVQFLSENLKLEPSNITILAAPASSLAGTIQVVARSVETALHKLFELKFELWRVVSGFGTAPLPPTAVDEMQAIGRTNDAILYGGRVVLWVRASDEQIAELGPKVPSCSSLAHGEPFATIFEQAGRDFYKIDPMLFSPAEIVFNNLATGKSFTFGRIESEVLKRSFGPS